jgi:hypothetical protein
MLYGLSNSRCTTAVGWGPLLLNRPFWALAIYLQLYGQHNVPDKESRRSNLSMRRLVRRSVRCHAA